VSVNALLFLAMSLVWGLTWLPVKLAAAEVPPVFLAASRFVIAGALYFAWAALARQALGTTQPVRLALASLLINTGCYGLLFWGIARAPTGLSAIVNLSLIPVFAIALGAAYGEERITGRRLAAVALGAVGLVALFSGRMASGSDSGALIGLAAVVVATFSYSWGAVVSRPLAHEMSPVALAAWQTALGGLGLMAVALMLEPVSASTAADLARASVWPHLAFLVLGGSLIGFTVYLRLLRDWGPFRAGLYAFVSPAIAVAVGVIWLDEPFGWPEAAGSVLMFGATALALKPVPPPGP
jgi:drug/metabolite transporter (DMT)-like permease